MTSTRFIALVGAVAASVGFAAATAAPASAATSAPSRGPEVVKICSGDCDTLRAVFYDSLFTYSGDRIEYYGGSSCSATTTDADYSLSVLPAGWNDRISSIEDFNGCDVKLYWDTHFLGEHTGYVNYGDRAAGGGRHLSVHWSNDVSSFQIS